MKVGYLLDTHAGPYAGPVPDRETVAHSMEAFLEEGRIADEVGFDSIQVPERHMRTETHFPSPLQLLTALAPMTKRAKLATHTLVLTLYHPMHVAEQVAALDNLSRGRVILTVAMGYHDDYWRMFGMTGSIGAIASSSRLRSSSWRSLANGSTTTASTFISTTSNFFPARTSRVAPSSGWEGTSIPRSNGPAEWVMPGAAIRSPSFPRSGGHESRCTARPPKTVVALRRW